LKTKQEDPEFSVGYSPELPPGTRKFLQSFLLIVFVSIALGVTSLAFFQENGDRGHFEFGVLKTYEGHLYSDPLPMLRTAERSYILVGDGKFGADAWAEAWSPKAKGRRIRVRATLIERSPIAMLEIERETPPEILEESNLPQDLTHPPVEIVGEVDLQGELVDSKCYLGVMRPAVGKVHRACAIRCLSGGVPPGLLLRNAKLDTSVMVLLAQPGRLQGRVSPKWAAREVHAHGTLEIRDGIPVLITSSIELRK